jgi:hypothetical protein
MVFSLASLCRRGVGGLPTVAFEEAVWSCSAKAGAYVLLGWLLSVGDGLGLAALKREIDTIKIGTDSRFACFIKCELLER